MLTTNSMAMECSITQVANYATQEAGTQTPFMVLAFFTTKTQQTPTNLQITKTSTLSIRIIGTTIKVNLTMIRSKASVLFT